jgi:prepilin-type N-terminal cleavage/methylation domain-containing protein
MFFLRSKMKKIKVNWKSQKGFSLVEVLVSVALLSIIGVAFLSSLGTASKTLMLTDEKQTARNIAELQMEYIKSQSWSINYSPMEEIPANYPGYSTEINTSAPRSPDINLQKIEVTVLHHGEPVYTLVSYKENKR